MLFEKMWYIIKKNDRGGTSLHKQGRKESVQLQFRWSFDEGNLMVPANKITMLEHLPESKIVSHVHLNINLYNQVLRHKKCVLVKFNSLLTWHPCTSP